MKESIHKKLTEHIRKTVGRHELPYEPGSWEEFQRLRRRRRQPVVWFRYSLAACLLLGVLGVPLWFYTDSSRGTEQAVKSLKTNLANKQPTRSSDQLHPSTNPKSSTQLADRNLPEKPLQLTDNDLVKQTQAEKTKFSYQKKRFPTLPENHALIGSNEEEPGIQSSLKTGFSQPSTPATDVTRNGNTVPTTAELSAVSVSFELIGARTRAPYRWAQRPLGLPLHMQPDAGNLAKIDRPKAGQKPVLGVSLAPQSVYHTGNAPALAMGGGLYSEIPLNRRISLSTGLSMAQQKLGITSDLIPLGTIPTLVATDIRLVAVDVPINLRFRPFKSARNSFYAEAGLSSVAFLNERYADTYQQQKPVTIFVTGNNGQPEVVTHYVTAQEVVRRTEPGLQKIYWGRIANFSVGVERRINGRFRLSAEPYLKYPIGPFTRENRLLGSGGINLRLGFQSGR